MFFEKSEKRRNPYVKMTVGTLAVIGAMHVVKCVKKTATCMRNKIRSAFGTDENSDFMI